MLGRRYEGRQRSGKVNGDASPPPPPPLRVKGTLDILDSKIIQAGKPDDESYSFPPAGGFIAGTSALRPPCSTPTRSGDGCQKFLDLFLMADLESGVRKTTGDMTFDWHWCSQEAVTDSCSEARRQCRWPIA